MASSSKKSISSTLAYVSMVLSAILWGLGALNNLWYKIFDKNLMTGKLPGALQTLAVICVYAVVALVAYDFTKGKKMVVKVFYWVFVVLFLLVVVLGVI